MAKYEDNWCQEAYDRGFKEGRDFEKDQLTKAKEIIKRFSVIRKTPYLEGEEELFSQQTISQKLKNARERNLCETTNELLSMYMTESGVKVGKCGKICKINCPKRDECGIGG